MTDPAAALRRRRFILCCAILLAAGLGMQPAARALQKRYVRYEVPPRQSMKSLETAPLRGFTLISSDITDPAATTAGLIGTSEYFKRSYDPLDPKLTLPAALFVTYYSGSEQQVPHTPDVCYREGGYALESVEGIDLAVEGPDGTTRAVPARLLRLSRPEPDGTRLDVVVIYLFCVNGEFVTRRASVRFEIAKFWQPAFFFSKIETMAILEGPETLPIAVEACRRLLEEALRVLIRDYYPTAQQLAAPTQAAGASQS